MTAVVHDEFGGVRGTCSHMRPGRRLEAGRVMVMAENDALSLSDPFTVPTSHWHGLPDGRIQCDVCPRACRLREGQRGLCFVRGVLRTFQRILC